MRKASVRETDGKGTEERRRREEARGGDGFLLLINYFRDKRWPAVEKRES